MQRRGNTMMRMSKEAPQQKTGARAAEGTAPVLSSVDGMYDATSFYIGDVPPSVSSPLRKAMYLIESIARGKNRCKSTIR